MKNNIREDCYHCKTSLSQYARNSKGCIVYKYCPKCGKENNTSIKTKRNFVSRWLKHFIGWLFLMFVIFLRYPKFLCFTIITCVVLLLYLINFCIFRSCSQCGNTYCYRSHHYCFNCGKLL